MGGGKSSGGGSTTVQITPEQRELMKAQTDFLTGTAFPAYQQTVGGAQRAYQETAPAAYTAAQTAMDVAQRSGAQQEIAGGLGLGLGVQGLASLFGQDYKNQQIQAALQAGREATREQLAGQNAMYGAAGGLGSARQALADANLRQLGEQRQATAAAAAAGEVEKNRLAAAGNLAGLGMQGLTGAQQAALSRVATAQTPQDIYSKYASVVYGIPQQSTTPNFAGTQGQTSSGQSSSKGFRLT